MKLTIQEATDIATSYLKSIEAEVGMPLSIVSGATLATCVGWLFFYNTEAFIREGNESSALAGNGPLLVRDDGSLRMIPSARDWREEVQALESE